MLLAGEDLEEALKPQDFKTLRWLICLLKIKIFGIIEP